MFRLSRRSRQRLEGVHPDLVRVVERAIQLTAVDFVVTEGVRTRERQRQLFKAKATTTMHSRHLTGHAVDLAAWVDSEVRWDWPLYSLLSAAMKRAAHELCIPLEWGGDWRSFKDGPHFQLPWVSYP